jgi:hypoxanthine-DNA glycosylase
MPDGRRCCIDGLSPVAGEDAAVLILGSFPSVRSLATGQYYANPQNQFWKILEGVTGIDHTLTYDERTGLLKANRIALWDVIRSCRRAGSADSRIKDPSWNDLSGFLASHHGIRLIACNGSASARFLHRGVIPDTVTVIRLPSTSPAHARLSRAEKTRQWSAILPYL